MTVFVLVIALFNQVPAGLNVFTTAASFKTEDSCFKRQTELIKQLDAKRPTPDAHYVVRCVETEVKK